MKKKNIPTRVCTVCKKTFPRNLLFKITFIHTEKQADVLLDEEYCIPGRSIYIYKSKNCLEKVLKEKKKIRPKLLKSHIYKNLENKIWQIIEDLVYKESFLSEDCSLCGIREKTECIKNRAESEFMN